ncbi:MAG: MerR family DNA-binding protein [Chloroflexi bacterium]|nr:MerR family DNA-binding protein [Chloroflexota bacterium]
MPRLKRATNNYRHYTQVDVERLRFIANARALDFSLDDIAEILTARDKGIAPCQRVLDTLTHHLTKIDQRIADLVTISSPHTSQIALMPARLMICSIGVRS